MSKRQRLAGLRKRIIEEFFTRDWREVWFYPKYKGVKGWEGAGDVMFVGLNPATANFGGFHDTLYYDSLRKYGFRNAHLTDIFKLKKTNKKVKEPFSLRDYRDARRFLSREMKILKPKLIVVLGKQKTKEEFEKLFPKLEPEIIGHYSYRYGSRAVLRRRWYREMRKARERYKKVLSGKS